MLQDTRKSADKLAVGDRVPYFSLRGTDSKIHTVNDFIGAPALVVIFFSNICPYCRVYEDRLIRLANEFGAKGVRFVAICSNDGEDFPEESFQHMITRAREMEAPFPFLHDESQVVAAAFAATATPEVFLFNSSLSLVYQGGIDDSPDTPEEVKTNYLKDAIEATLAGKMPTEVETQPFGCTIKWDT